jgi:hypothetical protein
MGRRTLEGESLVLGVAGPSHSMTTLHSDRCDEERNAHSRHLRRMT